MGPFPPSHKYTHILVAVDYVTKWVEAIPTESVDGGSHFTHGAFRKALAKYNVNHRIASPYHPKTSGLVELTNREIKLILQKIVNSSRKDRSEEHTSELQSRGLISYAV